MMKFQLESREKNEEKHLLTSERKRRKNLKNRGKTTTTSERKRRKNLKKNEEKQQRFFLELQKQQEALFKSLSNNQPTDSTSIFTQNAVWNALETLSYASDEDKAIEVYYRRYEDIYITDCADWTDAKNLASSTKGRNCGTQQVRRLYLKKNPKFLQTWLFRNS